MRETELTRQPLRAVEPGRDVSQAVAANVPNIAASTSRRQKARRRYRITPQAGGQPFTVAVVGREAWALNHLALAGAQGVTPIERPAPRWSAYIHALRSLGVPIETLHEKHHGEFAGTHARYVMRARVEPLQEVAQ